MNFSCIALEGGLLPITLLDDLLEGKAKGQKEADYGLPKGRRLTDEISSAWGDALAFWKAFQRALQHLPEKDPATSATREQWVVPLFRSLGYDQIARAKADQLDGETFAISHRSGPGEENLPIHIEGIRTDLGKRRAGGPRLSPHVLIQEYLNRTEYLWGIVTNGEKLRILRESSRTTRPTYVEFDLRQMMEGEKYSEFVLFYRLVHQSRFPVSKEKASQCWLETYHRDALESGGRVRDKLRDGVEQAIKIFGNGFLNHPQNEALLEKIRKNELKTEDYYRQLLRLIYRLLFLLVSEERDLVSPADLKKKKIYLDCYSISSLRRLAELPTSGSDHYSDLWVGLLNTFRLFSDDSAGRSLEISPLNGELFGNTAIPDLENTRLLNVDLLKAINGLSLYQDEESKTRRRVNYKALDVEELGSVYESLLDFHPVFVLRENKLDFELAAGTERKSTGSYYTRPELVHELIKSALVPVMEEKLKEATSKEEKEQALLSLKVCDPACGSGHFLLAAARRIGKELAQIRSGENEPTPDAFRTAVRDCISHCIYGVDLNPLAVDLCKLALWIEGHSSGKPLSFLDHRIKCGNSLIGVFSREDILRGIPDDAFDAVTGDDKAVARALKTQNKKERSGQITFDQKLRETSSQLAKTYQNFDLIAEDTPEAVHRKTKAYEAYLSEQNYLFELNLANMWTAAYFCNLTEAEKTLVPTHGKLVNYLQKAGFDPKVPAHAMVLAHSHKFFHWFLEFPDVFEHGGFDVVLGNPPWETLQLKEEEFFTSRDPQIATAPNKAARERLIQKLPHTNLSLWNEYQEAKHFAEAQNKYLRESDRFPLTARGKINTYAVFAELFRSLLNISGRAGLLCPTGIATDDTCKDFFANLVETRTLVAFIGMDNERMIYFPGIDHRNRFGLLFISGLRSKVEQPSFTFFCSLLEQTVLPERRYQLSRDDLQLLNPNTLTCPVFRTLVDAELTRKIYRNVPVLMNERTSENPWEVSFKQGMFNMSSDSHLFRTSEQLEKEGFHLLGNRFVKGSEIWLPLYEAKMIWQFDHRYGSYESRGNERGFSTLPIPSPEMYANPLYLSHAFYFVQASQVFERLPNYQPGCVLGFRDVTSAVVERTAIFSFLPRTAVGHKIPLLLLNMGNPFLLSCFLAGCNSLVFDYVARQKIGGTSMSFFYVKQFPILPPSAYATSDLEFIVPRVLELVYTAWDIKIIADDVWRDANESLRALIRKQHEENKQVTGGHEWKLPDWIEAYPEIEIDPKKGIPFPPFKWDEARRALLRAELDAYYAKLYGLTEEELRYVLDPHDVYGPDFPGETFRVLKDKETKQFGEYRTRRLVLEAWDRLFAASTSSR